MVLSVLVAYDAGRSISSSGSSSALPDVSPLSVRKEANKTDKDKEPTKEKRPINIKVKEVRDHIGNAAYSFQSSVCLIIDLFR